MPRDKIKQDQDEMIARILARHKAETNQKEHDLDVARLQYVMQRAHQRLRTANAVGMPVKDAATFAWWSIKELMTAIKRACGFG